MKREGRSYSCEVPPFPYRNRCLRDELPSGWLPDCSKLTPLYLPFGQYSLYP